MKRGRSCAGKPPHTVCSVILFLIIFFFKNCVSSQRCSLFFPLLTVRKEEKRDTIRMEAVSRCGLFFFIVSYTNTQHTHTNTHTHTLSLSLSLTHTHNQSESKAEETPSFVLSLSLSLSLYIYKGFRVQGFSRYLSLSLSLSLCIYKGIYMHIYQRGRRWSTRRWIHFWRPLSGDVSFAMKATGTLRCRFLTPQKKKERERESVCVYITHLR